MKPERIILALVALLTVAGGATWAIAGIEGLRRVGLWFLFAALCVSALPLIAWLVDLVAKRRRD